MRRGRLGALLDVSGRLLAAAGAVTAGSRLRGRLAGNGGRAHGGALRTALRQQR